MGNPMKKMKLLIFLVLLCRICLCGGDLVPVPCGAHSNCGECLNDRNCGWCDSTKQCHEGVSSGPLYGLGGECEDWKYRTCESPICGRIRDCQKCVLHEFCGWCDFGPEQGGKCRKGSSLGPAFDMKSDRKDTNVRCGKEPEPLNGFNHFWSHHSGLSCPRTMTDATKVPEPETITRDLEVGITLVHERERLRGREEIRIQRALSNAISLPFKGTKIFVSGVTREDGVNGTTTGTTYKVDMVFTALGLNETRSKQVISDLDRVVSDGTLNNIFFKRNLAFTVRELHTMPLKSTGTRSESSVQEEFEPLPPVRIELDPLWTEDEPLENVTTEAPVEMIHSLTDHPHKSGMTSRFRRQRSELKSSSGSSRDGMIQFLRSQLKSTISKPGLDQEQRAILESNFQMLESCLQDSSQSLEDCGL